MNLTHARIDESDLIGCAELYAATFREPPWDEMWNIEDAFRRLNDMLACPNSIAIKAAINQQICGFLFGEIQQWNGFLVCYLKEVCVSQEARRKGVGTSLLRELEEVMAEQGVSRIYLITQRDGIPFDFYASVGFSENENVTVMGKKIEG